MRAPGPNQRFEDQEWLKSGGSAPQEDEVDPKHTGQTLRINWQHKSDARSCYVFLLPGHIAADCTTDKGQAAALRVIFEWLATAHEYVLSKHDARSECVPGTGRTAWTRHLQGRRTCGKACGR
jgi:hypothetical protein